MDEEDCCMTLLCYFPNSWDNKVIIIGSIANKLLFDEVMVSLLSEKMR